MRSTKHRPLRFTLTVTITVIIVTVSLFILGISYYGSARSLLVLSENMTAEISKGIVEKINTLMSSAENANAVVNLMMTQGTLNPADGQRTMDVAAALVSHNEGFSSLEIGLPDGSKYMAERAEDGGIFRYSNVRTRSNVIRTYFYENPNAPNQYQNSIMSLDEGYDARKRPWFTKAISVGKTIWTDMYVSGTSKQFIYSCATPIYGKDGALIAVTAVNIKLATLSQFLGTLRILEHGRAFVMNDHDQVIAVPIKSMVELDRLFKPSPPGSVEPYQLYPIKELPDEDLRRTLLSYGQNGKRFFELDGQNGEPNVVSLVEHPYSGGPTFTIGIIFPKSDIMGSISRNTRLMLVGVLLFLLFAILIGFRIAQNISSSLAVLCAEVDKVSRLELDSTRVVESRILEVARIDEAVSNMRRGLRSFKRYVPLDLVLQLNALKKEAVLEGEDVEVSIFFSDIVDFTSISEQLTPEDLVQRLSVYFSGMTRIVLDQAGTLDKYIGDSIMAFWGAPLPRENHAHLACIAALKCQEYLDRLAREWQSESHPVFRTRIGIHTGKVIVGNIGSNERMNYTIIGDAANLASRLEGLNKFYQTRLIISEDTFIRVQNYFIARKLDRVAVKGRSRGVQIYELIAARGEINGAIEAFLQAYDSAVELYLNRFWGEAKVAFEAAQKLSPSGRDYPSGLLGARCDEFMRNPPGPEWNGVYTHQSK